MPDYSRIATDGRAVPQTYRGEMTSTEEVPSAYSKELITDLARNKMGFDGYVNSDSGITTVQIYGVENLTEPERYAKAISAGTDVIGGNTDPENIVKAVEDGLLPKADLDRASYNRLLSLFRTKRVDNPYLDPDKADQARVDNFDGAKKKAYEANQKDRCSGQKPREAPASGQEPEGLHRHLQGCGLRLCTDGYRLWVPVWATRTRMPLCARP